MAKESIRTIAKALNLSTSTVSLAISGSNKISKKTLKRVQSYAKSVNYQPNPDVSKLLTEIRKSSGKTDRHSIAYLTCHSSSFPLLPIFQCYHDGAKEECERSGYTFEHFDLIRDGLSPKRLQEILDARGVEGIIIAPGPIANNLPKINTSSQKCLAIGFSFPHATINRISFDHFGSTFLAMEELYSRGYRRIGFVFPESFSKRFQYRWDAAYFAFLRANKLDQITFCKAGGDPEEFEKWIKQQRPDVIVECFPHYIDQLITKGHKLGPNLGYICLSLDTIDIHKQTRPHEIRKKFPNVTGIIENTKLTGSRAVQLVANDIVSSPKTDDNHCELHLIPGTWHEGETIATKSLQPE